MWVVETVCGENWRRGRSGNLDWYFFIKSNKLKNFNAQRISIEFNWPSLLDNTVSADLIGITLRCFALNRLSK